MNIPANLYKIAFLIKRAVLDTEPTELSELPEPAPDLPEPTPEPTELSELINEPEKEEMIRRYINLLIYGNLKGEEEEIAAASLFRQAFPDIYTDLVPTFKNFFKYLLEAYMLTELGGGSSLKIEELNTYIMGNERIRNAVEEAISEITGEKPFNIEDFLREVLFAGSAAHAKFRNAILYAADRSGIFALLDEEARQNIQAIKAVMKLILKARDYYRDFQKFLRLYHDNVQKWMDENIEQLSEKEAKVFREISNRFDMITESMRAMD